MPPRISLRTTFPNGYCWPLMSPQRTARAPETTRRRAVRPAKETRRTRVSTLMAEQSGGHAEPGGSNLRRAFALSSIGRIGRTHRTVRACLRVERAPTTHLVIRAELHAKSFKLWLFQIDATVARSHSGSYRMSSTDHYHTPEEERRAKGIAGEGPGACPCRSGPRHGAA